MQNYRSGLPPTQDARQRKGYYRRRFKNSSCEQETNRNEAHCAAASVILIVIAR